MKEMLGEHNEYGVVTKNDEDSFFEGVKELLENRKLLEYYRSQAIIRGNAFNTENTVKETEKMFIELVGEKND